MELCRLLRSQTFRMVGYTAASSLLIGCAVVAALVIYEEPPPAGGPIIEVYAEETHAAEVTIRAKHRRTSTLLTCPHDGSRRFDCEPHNGWFVGPGQYEIAGENFKDEFVVDAGATRVQMHLAFGRLEAQVEHHPAHDGVRLELAPSDTEMTFRLVNQSDVAISIRDQSGEVIGHVAQLKDGAWLDMTTFECGNGIEDRLLAPGESIATGPRHRIEPLHGRIRYEVVYQVERPADSKRKLQYAATIELDKI